MVAGRAVVYTVLSEKYASCAVIKFRRSDFIVARYAFSFVLANFGIAIAARMPMMTTTIRSSIRVKPFRLNIQRPFQMVTFKTALTVIQGDQTRVMLSHPLVHNLCPKMYQLLSVCATIA